VQVVHNEERHRFEIDLGDGLAVADYNRLAHALMFTHTEVPPAHEGKGIATKLIEAGLAAARAEQLKVIPACAAFAHYFRKHPEVRDLLEPSYISVLGLNRS
jgi:uncharacterized protein